jgi:hypothetical protein
MFADRELLLPRLLELLDLAVKRHFLSHCKEVIVLCEYRSMRATLGK